MNLLNNPNSRKRAFVIKGGIIGAGFCIFYAIIYEILYHFFNFNFYASSLNWVPKIFFMISAPISPLFALVNIFADSIPNEFIKMSLKLVVGILLVIYWGLLGALVGWIVAKIWVEEDEENREK